jgi:hypothetical protein
MAWMPDEDPRAALILQEAVRALDQQSESLNELRNRTGVLLSASAVSSAFLGAAALQFGGTSVVNVIAALVFAGAVALCLGVLLPADDWEFRYGTETLEATYMATNVGLADMQRSMAKGYSESWKENDDRLEPLYRLFRCAVAAVGLDVLLWLLGLRIK